jgi:hypothetical protein
MVNVTVSLILQTNKFSEGMHDITTYIKDVLKTLRELKKSSGLAFEMLKLLSDGQESSVVMLSLLSKYQVHFIFFCETLRFY